MKNILMQNNKGFTILELAAVCAVTGILVWIGATAFSAYREKALVAQSIAEIQIIEKTVVDLAIDNNAYPDSLDEVGLIGFLDPWGHPYQYLKVRGCSECEEEMRKDRFLALVNSDFDLYSMGKDGISNPIFTAKESQDDIVRAKNGNFYGPVTEY